jgi:hypothetical protein
MKRIFDYLFRGQNSNEAEVFNRAFFEQTITPVFKLAQVIFADHRETLAAIKASIERGDSVPDVILKLEQGRIEHLENRIRLRGALSTRLGHIYSKLSTFERGLWGLLRGGMATWEDGRVNLEPYGRGNRHTLLDILYHISGAVQMGGPMFSNYDADTCTDMIAWQIKVITEAMEEIELSYKEYEARLP